MAGEVGFLLAGFKKNRWWGISMVLVPFIPIIIFVFVEFRKSLIPLTFFLLGIGLMLIGNGIGK